MIAIASDHGGFELKEAVKKHLEKRGFEYKDFGTHDTNS
jgi:ribose 5-phosphate isomerase B